MKIRICVYISFMEVWFLGLMAYQPPMDVISFIKRKNHPSYFLTILKDTQTVYQNVPILKPPLDTICSQAIHKQKQIVYLRYENKYKVISMFFFH